MLHLLNRTIELEAMIKELQECANYMDNESSVFHNTAALIKDYTIEKIRLEEVMEIWRKSKQK